MISDEIYDMRLDYSSNGVLLESEKIRMDVYEKKCIAILFNSTMKMLSIWNGTCIYYIVMY